MGWGNERYSSDFARFGFGAMNAPQSKQEQPKLSKVAEKSETEKEEEIKESQRVEKESKARNREF